MYNLAYIGAIKFTSSGISFEGITDFSNIYLLEPTTSLSTIKNLYSECISLTSLINVVSSIQLGILLLPLIKSSFVFKDFIFPEVQDLEKESINFFNILKNSNFESISFQNFKNLELIIGTKKELWQLTQDEEKEDLIKLDKTKSEIVRNSMIEILTTFKLVNLDSIYSKLFCDLISLKLRGQDLSINEYITKEEFKKENLEFSFKLINKSNYLFDLISNNKNKIKIQEINDFIKIDHSDSNKCLLIYPYSYECCPEGFFGFSIEKELFDSGKIPNLEDVVKFNPDKYKTSSFKNKAQIVREIEDNFVIKHFFDV